MLTLTTNQLDEKLRFIDSYVNAANAATGSKYDQNANVTHKNVATLAAEMHKDINIQVNRKLMVDKITEMFDANLAQEYIRQIESHEIYVHDETSGVGYPYCASVSLYPLLTNGLMPLGGESRAPKNLESFCGIFINAIFAIAAQFAGAVATVEFLMYFDYFAKKSYGEDYLNTNRERIESHLQHVVYSLNQPAAARSYQSIFWNISIYDEEYFNSLFGEFFFPDGEQPQYESLARLQEFFMSWFNTERTKAVLTFPVVTAAMLTDRSHVKDRAFAEMCATQLAEGNSFFVYQSDSADSLASCCRLRNEIADNSFSYSLGAGGVSTGSVKVITLNINRITQLGLNLEEIISKVQKYLFVYKTMMVEMQQKGLLPVYDAGFISFDKQFITIGLNGVVEAAEFLKLETHSSNLAYTDWLKDLLKTFKDANAKFKEETGSMVNTEFVPAESLGVKFAKWDKEDGLWVPRDCYNSYFYAVEDDSQSVLSKMSLYRKDIVENLDGGSALHINLETYLSKEGYLSLLDIAARVGCNYFCTNVLVTLCDDCGYIDKRTLHICSKCKGERVGHATRIIGYLKRIDSFSEARKIEAGKRKYHKV